MEMLKLLFGTFWGSDSEDEKWSLRMWLEVLRRDTHLWTPKDKTFKSFEKSLDFLNQVVDGHILAMLSRSLDATSCVDLCEKLETINWYKSIKALTRELGDLNKVGELRECEMSQRDQVRENAILFVQCGLMLRDFSEAMRTGDSGRVFHCLKFFMIWLQGIVNVLSYLLILRRHAYDKLLTRDTPSGRLSVPHLGFGPPGLLDG
jgi:hypothetical protein